MAEFTCGVEMSALTKSTSNKARDNSFQIASMPLMLLGDPKWRLLTAQNVNRMTATLRRQLHVECSRGLARELALTLTARPGAASPDQLEVALRQFPRIIAEEIVSHFCSADCEAPNANAIFAVGKDIQFRIDEAIRRGQALIQASISQRPVPQRLSPSD